MIEELRSKEMKLEQEHEMQVLQKLKAKMDRIKATQQKLLESAKEPSHHGRGKKFYSVQVFVSAVARKTI